MNASARYALLVPVLAAALLVDSCSTAIPGAATMTGLRTEPNPSAPQIPLAPPHLSAEPDPGGMSGPGTGDAAIGPASGAICDGQSVSPFGEDLPAIVRLDPSLIAAVRAAAHDAEAAGIQLRVTSGWRSADYQRQLLEDAIVTFGSLERAHRFISPPDLSRYVTGEAIDIGHAAAADWLGRNGSDYGPCQVYANEAWHFELLAGDGGVCPPLRPNASAG